MYFPWQAGRSKGQQSSHRVEAWLSHSLHAFAVYTCSAAMGGQYWVYWLALRILDI